MNLEKYLPIGSVCTLDRINRKYVIIGYFSLEYNTNIKMYDYIGVPYPEGMLLHNKILSFNHDDILKVDFLGYSDEKYELFNNKILEQTNEVDSIEQDNDIHYNFTFDENGVVVYEYETVYKDEKTNSNNFAVSEEVENPFNKKYDFSNQTNDSQNTNETWSIFEKYEFDKNGNVVSDEVVEEAVSEEEKEYEFDENGVLVAGEE